MNRHSVMASVGLAVLIALPLVTPPYFLHLLIQILLWGFIYTAWSLMGRFGFVSLGHGAFMGIGAYVPALLWNYEGITPWLGIPVSVVFSVMLAVVIGYPCFRLKVIGHYFALVTLALGQVVMLSIVAARDITGGSLGMTPKAVGQSWYALQFPDKRIFYCFALLVWLGGLGNMIGGFIASFIISQIISIGGYYWSTELSYVLAFSFFIVLMLARPRGIFAR